MVKVGSSISGGFQFQDLDGGMNKTLFGGRERLLMVEIWWLRKWIQYCERQYHSACSLTDQPPQDSHSKL